MENCGWRFERVVGLKYPNMLQNSEKNITLLKLEMKDHLKKKKKNRVNYLIILNDSEKNMDL